jgi:dTDP-4-dehydrorhamnose 3,5-epimerase-like enzyme
MISIISEDSAKKVPTYELDGHENGFLMELFKDGNKTVAYLSATNAGGFKGYHWHRVRAARYVCLKGKIKIILFVNGKFEEHLLTPGKKLNIPKQIPTGLQNVGDEETWLINYPDPPYDPNLKDEQVDYTKDELEKGKVKNL